ncbi:MAG: hypothetical protein ACLFSB_04085 [Chitinispirillaceae bacterium]
MPDVIAASPKERTQKTINPFLEETGLNAQIWVEINYAVGESPPASRSPQKERSGSGEWM